jgi:hypothetical protein
VKSASLPSPLLTDGRPGYYTPPHVSAGDGVLRKRERALAPHDPSQSPAPMPPAILKTLEAAFADAVKDPVFIDFMKKRKMTVATLTSEQLGKLTKELYPRIEKMAPALQREMK